MLNRRLSSQLAIIVRGPRNSEGITIAARMRLSDRACVCLLVATKAEDASYLMARCMEQTDVLGHYPFQLMIFLLEKRLSLDDSWLRSLWKRVDSLEKRTGMTPWIKPTDASNQPDKDYGPILQQLHALDVELTLAETTLKFTKERIRFCNSTLALVEKTREELGLQAMERSRRQSLEGEIQYDEKLCQFTGDKFHELLSRVKTQINVVSGIHISVLSPNSS
jgi:hypothetical protein